MPTDDTDHKAAAGDAKPATATRETDIVREKNAHPPAEIGGRKGLDPTRYGDWEKAGRCIDF
ncbi:MAG: DUF1674 domain-containing protein [Gammaproteobacteria bacterium]|nr:DUF1674 domain-containing protein [Gammaproteobacteria bacterium]MDH3373864.1 DUF1674 domain-containing protein [Gammaproteobacteria bacterium]MDH3408406.1 DUF1674 domain-containing protein [Gammaproteobacteria bacterium]MDH3554099.1 DUF1674 domain-containing protein [Gammaproteobacteria bacterium]